MQTRVIEDIPVILYNTENIERSNLVMLPNQKFSVNLKIKGRTLDVFKVTKDDFKVEADMGGYLKRGDNNIPIEVKKKPQGVEIVSEGIFPYIRVTLDNLIAKTFNANIKSTGIPKNDYNYSPPIVKPSEVIVIGPEEYVNRVRYVEGQIDITNLTQDTTNSVVIKPYDREGKVVPNLEVDPKYVDVFLSIKPIKDVPIKIVTKNSPPKGKVIKSIVAKEDKITIIGDKNILNKISEISTQAIDLSKINESTTIEVAINVPKGVNVKNDKVNVSINIENIIEKEVSIPVIIKNQKDQFVYTPSQNEIKVLVKAPEGKINQFDFKNVTVDVDVSELEEGQNTVKIDLVNLNDLQVLKIEPDTIDVTVSKK